MHSELLCPEMGASCIVHLSVCKTEHISVEFELGYLVCTWYVSLYQYALYVVGVAPVHRVSSSCVDCVLHKPAGQRRLKLAQC